VLVRIASVSEAPKNLAKLRISFESPKFFSIFFRKIFFSVLDLQIVTNQRISIAIEKPALGFSSGLRPNCECKVITFSRNHQTFLQDFSAEKHIFSAIKDSTLI